MNTRRMSARLRIYLHSLYKITISRLKLRYKRFNFIAVNRVDYLRINKDQDFITSIQLARFVSTITSAQRNLLRIPDNGRLPNTKDRIEQQYIYAAILYEIILTLSRLFGKLKHLHAWTANADRVAELNRQRSEKDSYYNQVLDPIRNQVAFHFDEAAVRKSVDLVKLGQRILLASNATKMNKDMVFSLVDDLVLNYVIAKDHREIPQIEKYEGIMKYVLELSEKIRNFCAECTLEIWMKFAYRACGRLDVEDRCLPWLSSVNAAPPFSRHLIDTHSETNSRAT